LTPAEQEQSNRARRKRGRPKVGGGFKRVSVSLEQGLLKRVTALAKKRRISRSSLVAKALEQALAREK
jgi:macrodomain Ter protein organizer (MatP/YcbG family)